VDRISETEKKELFSLRKGKKNMEGKPY